MPAFENNGTFFFFLKTVSLCSLGLAGTHFADQANLVLRDLPASARIKSMQHTASKDNCNFNTKTPKKKKKT